MGKSIVCFNSSLKSKSEFGEFTFGMEFFVSNDSSKTQTLLNLFLTLIL